MGFAVKVEAGEDPEVVLRVSCEISLRYYQQIEAGDRTGDFEVWDNLEDITGIHQRILRTSNPGTANNQ